MESRDLDLRLCAKDPIFVDGVPIYPISIKEISRIGYTKYNTDIRFMSLNESDIGALLGRDISDIGSFNYLVGNAIHDKETMQMMLFWLSKITHSKITFSGKRLSFVGDGFEITKDIVSGVFELGFGQVDITSLVFKEEKSVNIYYMY